MGNGKLKKLSGCQMDCLKQLYKRDDGMLVAPCPYASDEYEKCYYEEAPEKLLDIVSTMNDILNKLNEM